MGAPKTAPPIPKTAQGTGRNPPLTRKTPNAVHQIRTDHPPRTHARCPAPSGRARISKQGAPHLVTEQVLVEDFVHGPREHHLGEALVPPPPQRVPGAVLPRRGPSINNATLAINYRLVEIETI